MKRTLRHAGDLSGLPNYSFGPTALGWWGVIGFMLIEGTGFVLAIGAYYYLLPIETHWPPASHAPPLLWGTLFMLVGLASEIPNVWITKKAKAQDLQGVRTGLAAMTLIGLGMLVLRALEMSAMNVRWDYTAYGSIVWALLALHTFHTVTDVYDSVVLARVGLARADGWPKVLGRERQRTLLALYRVELGRIVCRDLLDAAMDLTRVQRSRFAPWFGLIVALAGEAPAPPGALRYVALRLPAGSAGEWPACGCSRARRDGPRGMAVLGSRARQGRRKRAGCEPAFHRAAQRHDVRAAGRGRDLADPGDRRRASVPGVNVRWLAVVSIAGLLPARAALAHAVENGINLAWTLDPWITVPLALALAWFAFGYRRLTARSMHPQGHRTQAAWFGLGWSRPGCGARDAAACGGRAFVHGPHARARTPDARCGAAPRAGAAHRCDVVGPATRRAPASRGGGPRYRRSRLAQVDRPVRSHVRPGGRAVGMARARSLSTSRWTILAGTSSSTCASSFRRCCSGGRCCNDAAITPP